MGIRTSVASVIAGLALVALAGCSGDATPSTTPGDNMSPTTTTTMPASPSETAFPIGDAVVSATTVDLGTILVDESGQVLYTFDADAGESTCYDSCAVTWPPLLTGASGSAGTGVDATLLGTTVREDGALQVTYGGWPLYYYDGDSADGAANGQGVGGVWWVIDPTGAQIR